MINQNSIGILTTYPPTSSSTTAYIHNTGYKKPDFEEYKKKLKDSERIAITLKLFKKGNLTLDEAMEMIASDAQFHKEELNRESWYSAPAYVAGSTTISYPTYSTTATGYANNTATTPTV